MKQILETSVSSLRMTVDPEAAPVMTGRGFLIFTYQSDDPEPRYAMEIEVPLDPEYRLDIRNVHSVYQEFSEKGLTTIAALLAEGQVSAIPTHYRVLSVLRAIELLYPDEKERNKALSQFDAHFAALGISKQPLRKALPQLRTRGCYGPEGTPVLVG